MRFILPLLAISLIISACGGSSGNVKKSGDVPSWNNTSTSSTDSTYMYGFGYVLADDSADGASKARALAIANLESGFDDYLEELRLRMVSETSDETLNSMEFMSWYRLIDFKVENPKVDFYFPKSKPDSPSKMYARVSVELASVHNQFKNAINRSRYKSQLNSTAVVSGL